METNRETNRDVRLKSEFNQIKDKAKPKVQNLKHVASAFCVGGGVCMLGQFVKDMVVRAGVEESTAGSYSTLFLVLLTAILTALGLFDKIGRFAGAGTFVPISGFANSVVACAIEYKSEGNVFGIGSQVFKVAGPVILFGTFSSWCVGLIYYLLTLAR
jgi:stage V sporulation protein AC